jgi:predicted RNA-binding protein with PUA-like domain
MSYPSGLTDEEMRQWQAAMNHPIANGTIIEEHGVKFEVLEDTTAHGCALVRIIDPGETGYARGEETYRTLYQHSQIVKGLLAVFLLLACDVQCVAAADSRPVLYVFAFPAGQCAGCDLFKADVNAGRLDGYCIEYVTAHNDRWDRPEIAREAEARTQERIASLPTFWLAGSNRLGAGYDKNTRDQFIAWLNRMAGAVPTHARQLQPQADPVSTPAEPDWSQVTIVVLAAEQDVNTVRGMARKMALDRIKGPLRRRLREATGEKARLELIAQRVDPQRFEAVCEAAGIEVEKFCVIVCVKRQTHGLKGMIARKVMAAKEDAILGKLTDAPVEVILGDLHPQDYQAVISALEPREPEAFIRDPFLKDSETTDGLAGITKQIKEQGNVVDGIAHRLAVLSTVSEPKKEPEKQIPFRDEGLLGGLAFLVLERIQRRFRGYLAARKAGKEQAA